MNGHNHVVDPTESQVKNIKSNLHKRTREEVVYIPVTATYNDALVQLSIQDDVSSVAPKLPTFSSMKSSHYCNRRSRQPVYISQISVSG